MDWFAPLLAILLSTGLKAPAGPPADLPADAVVAPGGAEAFALPDPLAAPAFRLRAGESVRVLDVDSETGWLTIASPRTAFDWVPALDLRSQGERPGLARVVAARSVVRAGIAGAKLPGPPRALLSRGTVVALADLPTVVTGIGKEQAEWVAIRSVPGSVHYLAPDRVVWQTSGPHLFEPEVSRVAAFVPGAANAGGLKRPPALGAEMEWADAEHRAALNAPVEQWRLGPVRARYEAMRKAATDPAVREALDARLIQVAGEEDAGRAARAVQTILDRSRRRDREVELTRRKLAEVDRPRRRAFVAQGLMQASSRQVEGHRVYALIGDEGRPIAYLDVPPGLDARPLVSRRVGVRGGARFDPDLGAKLIAVKDFEALD